MMFDKMDILVVLSLISIVLNLATTAISARAIGGLSDLIMGLHRRLDRFGTGE
jgi:hypothetical protein